MQWYAGINTKILSKISDRGRARTRDPKCNFFQFSKKPNTLLTAPIYFGIKYNQRQTKFESRSEVEKYCKVEVTHFIW